MFPPRQRRAFPPQYPSRYQRRRTQRAQSPNNPKLLSLFQDNEGKFDMNRIFSSVNQMQSAYKQVSPLIKGFIKR
ncbi:hypothetical protein CWR48_12290 [Oceanobacillus arenosus]|uniref:YppG-like protein n=1 Tax=Oceanobacillus arenosus TaxID=1229153 RepID=A0A3D8PST6_9BACI|nr:hypothetical protein CWR48_12290 [Oceanobacillus arenosus]